MIQYDKTKTQKNRVSQMIKENKSLASCCINTQNQLQCYISSTNRNVMLKSFIIHTKIEVSKKKAKKNNGKTI